MQLSIAARLRPFTHSPGMILPIPGAPYAARVWPTRVEILDLRGPVAEPIGHLAFDVIGPVDDFTAVMDLEQGGVRVWGHGREGYFRYRLGLLADRQCLGLQVERAPDGGLRCAVQGPWNAEPENCIEEKDFLLLSGKGRVPFPSFSELPSRPRLSLGVHKAQDWDMLWRRFDLGEILPFVLSLGTLYSVMDEPMDEGVYSALAECRALLESRERLRLQQSLEGAMAVAFDGLLNPQLRDQRYQGIQLPPLRSGTHASLIGVLPHFARLIQDIFVQSGAEHLALLPGLCPDMHCGRYLAYNAPWGA
ncbi:MAG: hypothetical protein KDK78_03120 [Chlamydiia bacterium]|nr:hypothetical protein [Chlamydiia bacterium]